MNSKLLSDVPFFRGVSRGKLAKLRLIQIK